MSSVHLELTESRSSRPTPLKLVWFCTGSSDPTEQISANISALNFLRALKGERITGEATIPMAGKLRRLNNDNLDEAIDWFGEMVANYFLRQSIPPPFFVVPIPDTNTTLESSAGPWTSLTAMAIASKFEGEAEALDVLRWKKGMSSLGTEAKDPARLCENLAVLGRIAWDRPVVLVDYLADAARAQACAAFLGAQGARVLLCVLAGRIVPEKIQNHFGVFRVEISGIHPTLPG